MVARPPRLPALLVPLLLCATSTLLRRGPGTPPPFASAFVASPAGPGRSSVVAAAPVAAADALASDAEETTREGASEGAWMPPSQNLEQRRGNVFTIRQPEDLLDFVMEDGRLSVVKVYASWCKTCRAFDLRYRKLASRLGDERDASQRISQEGRARFAEMELKDDNEQILRALLPPSKQPVSLPYMLIYKEGRMERDFRCPRTFRALADAVEEMAADPDVASGGRVRRGTRSHVMGGGDATTDETTAETTTTSGNGLGAAQSYLSTLGAP